MLRVVTVSLEVRPSSIPHRSGGTDLTALP